MSVGSAKPGPAAACAACRAASTISMPGAWSTGWSKSTGCAVFTRSCQRLA